MPNAVILNDSQECGSSLDFITMIKNNYSEWVKNSRISLLASHKKEILNEDDELDDAIITFAQRLLKRQFPNIHGLQNTLLQGKKQVNTSGIQQLQVIHSHGNHWITASTVHDKESNKVMIYDSLYDNIDAGTQGIIYDVWI